MFVKANIYYSKTKWKSKRDWWPNQRRLLEWTIHPNGATHNEVRKRKGLQTDQQVVVSAEKQKNMNKKK